MQNNEAVRKSGTGAFTELVISVVKIFIVLVITLTVIFYIANPPGTRSFFTNSTQSDTIVRTVIPA